MFTGIVETVGTLIDIRSRGNYRLLTIRPEKSFDDIILGESIAVDGCCLTVTKTGREVFIVEASQETIKHTTVGSYAGSAKVNLERAMLANSRFGGHIVSGHIDCLGVVKRSGKTGESLVITINYPSEFSRYLVVKGSIAINGISLTVNNVDDRFFDVNMIPFTQSETNLKGLKAGGKVNLEFDIMGKYAAKILGNINGNKSAKDDVMLGKFRNSGW